MNRKVTILAALFAVLFSLDALAWGGLGHRTIAEIAERNLTPKAKANIEKYTLGAPLASFSVWMDTVRNLEDKGYAEATDGWHASIVDTDCNTSQEIRNKGRNGRDAVTATLMFTEMFKEREKLSDSTVMFAIKCLVHMVGDIHCPAHVRYTDNNNDGKFAVSYMGKETTLHKVWDTSVIARDHKKWGYKRYAEHLDSWSKRDIKRVTKGWVEDWFEDAARDVRPTLAWVNKGDKLDEEFQTKALPLAEQQLRKAGYQLAHLLNTLFK